MESTEAEVDSSPPVAAVRPPQRSRRVFSAQGGKKIHNPRRLLLQDSDEDETSSPVSARSIHARSVSDTTPTTPSFSEIMATLDDSPAASTTTDLLTQTQSPESFNHLNSPSSLRRHSRVSSKRLSTREMQRLASNITEPDVIDTRRLSSASTLSARRSLHRAMDSPMMSSAFSSSFTSLLETDGMSQERVESIRILRRRQAILRELVLTELSFAEDLALVVNEYEHKTSSCPALSVDDARQIFGGVEPVLSFSSDFGTELQTAVSAVLFSEAVSYETLMLEDASTTVGVIFGQFMNRLSKVFSNYCSIHERAAASLQRVAETPAINQWLAERHPADRTTAWDLPSLLIKPVQRVLKYPLLLSTLLQATPKTHPDYYMLELALKEMLLTAENINNIKKRHDLMGNIAAERKRNAFDLQTNITKTFTRKTNKLKQAAGIEDVVSSRDAIYDALANSFVAQEALLQTLRSEVSEWLLCMKSSLEYHANLSLALRNIEMCQDAPVSSFDTSIPWADYASAISDVQQGPFVEMTHNLEREVFQPLSQLEASFANPKLIMAEREKNADDHNRAHLTLIQGIVPEKTTSDASDRFQQLNDMLIQELPRFLNIAKRAMSGITLGLASVQKRWYEAWSARLSILFTESNEPREIRAHFRERFAVVREYMDNFTLLSPHKPGRQPEIVLRSSEDSGSTAETSIRSNDQIGNMKLLSRVVNATQRRPSLRERAQSAASSASVTLKAFGPTQKSSVTTSYALKVETQ